MGSNHETDEKPAKQDRRLQLENQRLAEETRKLEREGMRLSELRQSLETAQAELATELQVSQPAVSQLENASDMLISTLRRYVESLGGRLEMNAVFDKDGAAIGVSIMI